MGKTEEKKPQTYIPLNMGPSVHTHTDHRGRVTTLHLGGHQHLSHLSSCKKAAKRFFTEFRHHTLQKQMLGFLDSLGDPHTLSKRDLVGKNVLTEIGVGSY